MYQNKLRDFNPFDEISHNSIDEDKLVQSAITGDQEALKKLILLHQSWIFNIALRMVYNRQEAEDITQEVLIKIITKLSSFNFKSAFRTWVYRITVNHLINMKKRRSEQLMGSFINYDRLIDESLEVYLADTDAEAIASKELTEQVMQHCMTGMIVCLDRKKRIIFILGEVFNISSKLGADLLDISPANFRQMLSRSRKQVFGFMRNKCGVVDNSNTCRCKYYVPEMVKDQAEQGIKPHFTPACEFTIGDVTEKHTIKMQDYIDRQCRELFGKHPFEKSDSFVTTLQEMISSNTFRAVFKMAD